MELVNKFADLLIEQLRTRGLNTLLLVIIAVYSVYKNDSNQAFIQEENKRLKEEVKLLTTSVIGNQVEMKSNQQRILENQVRIINNQERSSDFSRYKSNSNGSE